MRSTAAVYVSIDVNINDAIDDGVERCKCNMFMRVEC